MSGGITRLELGLDSALLETAARTVGTTVSNHLRAVDIWEFEK